MQAATNLNLILSDIFKPIEIRRICTWLSIAAGIHPDIGTYKPSRQGGAQDPPIHTFGNRLPRLRLGGDVEIVGLPVSPHLEVEAITFDGKLGQRHIRAGGNRH
jgi:hypothetical protein